MNKKEAVAYAQVTLDYMQSSKYNGNINPDTFGIEMRQSFKLYSKDIILAITNAQNLSRKKIAKLEGGDING